MIDNARIGENTKIHHPELCNIYGCTIGKNCNIGAYVEIGQDVVIGDEVSIGAFTYIPEWVIIYHHVFIGPRVTFLNDKYPPSKGEWRKKSKTLVNDHVVIGGGAIILPNIILGLNCFVGAGAVVTKNVHINQIVVGNPARDIHEKEIAGK